MNTRESIAAIALACILALVPAAALFAFFCPAKRYTMNTPSINHRFP